MTEASNKPEDKQQAAPMCGWAIGAFVCGLFVFCLPLCIFGGLLGLKALSEIRLDPRLGGRRLAIFGIVLSVLATLTWGSGAVWWQVNIRKPMISGPISALQSGWDGDLDGFREGFTDPGALVSDAQALKFLGELSNRYGKLLSMRQIQDDRPSATGYQMQSYGIPYEMEFEMGPIKAEGKFVISSPGDGFVGRFQWLAIFDPELGDLVFPVEATSQVVIPSPASEQSNSDDGN
ncbi:MAG: DUF4190 domain-containing protein [Planctomycetota bacterium]|nr:DUF4190 domain-containing protein [Planctomycetota bacterium]